MSDSKKPKPGQPAFLPRTWKAAPEPEVEAAPAGPARQSKNQKARRGDPSAKPGKKKKPAELDPAELATGSKLEETPLLDTFEGRQRVRYAVGGALSLVGLVGLVILIKTFQPGSPPSDPGAEKKEVKSAIDLKESAEREAAAMVDNARQADKLGRAPAAIALLRKVTRNYEGTEAARVALAALDRDRRNRPLFEVDALKNPTGPVAPGPIGPAPPGNPTGPGSGSVGGSGVAVNPGPVAPTAPSKPSGIIARPLPNGFRAESGAGIHPSGWPTRITCDRDGAAMILIPGTEFLMGRDDGDTSERPSHRVKLSTYYIDEHEVTNRQYQIYLKESGRAGEPGRSAASEPPDPLLADRLDLPVVSLTAREARSYCYWANRRLPTEAQWELAARSADGRVAYGGTRDALKVEATTSRPLDPVKSAPRDQSPFGGFDFAANAWEWTADYYDPLYYHQLRDVTADPTGPTQSRIKPSQVTVKGGSKLGILTWREGVRIEAKLPHLGFRGALPVELPAPAASKNQPNAPGGNPLDGGTIPF